MTDRLTPDERFQEEIGKIMADPEYPRSRLLQDKVTGMYETKYGTGKIKMDTGITIDHGPNLQIRPDPPPDTPDARTSAKAPAPAGVDPRLTEAMRPTWGAETEKNLVSAQNTASFLLGDAPELFEGLARAIGDDVVALKALHHVGQKLRNK